MKAIEKRRFSCPQNKFAHFTRHGMRTVYGKIKEQKHFIEVELPNYTFGYCCTSLIFYIFFKSCFFLQNFFQDFIPFVTHASFFKISNINLIYMRKG